MSSLEECTARLRLGRKEWAVVSRYNVDGKSHFYELPSAESSDSHMTCELAVLDRFLWLLEHAKLIVTVPHAPILSEGVLRSTMIALVIYI